MENQNKLIRFPLHDEDAVILPGLIRTKYNLELDCGINLGILLGLELGNGGGIVAECQQFTDPHMATLQDQAIIRLAEAFWQLASIQCMETETI